MKAGKTSSKGTTAKCPELGFRTQDSIKRVRQDKGLSQSEFWGRITVMQSGGSRYENGQAVPLKVQLLLNIAYGSERKAREVLAWMRERP